MKSVLLPDEVYDVAIVGLGPVAAVLGNLLGQAGLNVLVFERESEIVPIPRAVGFDDEIMRIFQSIGLVDALTPFLKVGTGGQYAAPSGEIVLRRPVSNEEGPQGWKPRYNFHQPNLEKVLRDGIERFDNVKVHLRHEVYAVDEFSDCVRVRVENTASGTLKGYRARFVIGCDGARSLVRRLLGTEMDDLGLHEPWVVADFILKRDPGLPPISTQFCHPVTPATFVHVIGNRRRMEFKLPPGSDLKNAAGAESVWSLANRWLTPADAELERAAFYTFHSLIAKQWRRDRLIIAGDAAHQTPPFLGQGLCAGIRDAANLAWKLLWILRHDAPLALLDSYTSERLPHAMTFVDGAVKVGAILKSKDANEMRQLASEIAPKPNELHNPTPPLGVGFNERTSLAGRLSNQARLADGRRMDDETGTGFSLVVQSVARRELSPELLRSLEKLKIRIVSATGGVEEWLRILRKDYVLLRPDRYIFADGDEVQSLRMVLQSLAEKLGLTVSEPVGGAVDRSNLSNG